MKKFLCRLLPIFAAVAASVTVAAEYRAWVLAAFPVPPEGLAVDSKGALYASLPRRSEIVKLAGDGNYQHVAWVPSKDEVGQGEVVGIEFDRGDNLYVTYVSKSKYDNLLDPFHMACRDATANKSGVYKVDAKTRQVSVLANKAQGWPFCVPDDVDIDSQGNVYMADLTFSGIWKISADGKQVELWSAHPLLNWSTPPSSGAPLGVNVLVLDKQEQNIYAATDGDPMILRIPIETNGKAGTPVAISRGHSPFDGIELDDDGNIYTSEILRNEIWVMSPDGAERVLVANKRSAPLDGNTSLVYRNGVLCTANLGFAHADIEHADKTVVCVSGFDKPVRSNAE